MTEMSWSGLICVLILLFIQEMVEGLKDVRLVAIPDKVVENGSTLSLVCQYDVRSEELYMVTWFRGNHQVFRYLPSDNPPTKHFPTPGIKVDMSESNRTALVLRRVQLQVSGRWGCEVTTESPNFSTAISTINITVIVLSRLDPVLWLNVENTRTQFKAGDILSANCSSPPSRPAANISFYLNQQPVTNQQGKSRVVKTWQAAVGQPSLYKSWGWMETQLSEYDVRRGFLVIECMATVSMNHTRTTFRHLKASLSQPNPQRVRMTSSRGITVKWINCIYVCITFCLASLLTIPLNAHH